MKTIEEIRARLFEMQDEAYRDFQAKLMPTVDRERIIGVRTPALRAYARELAGENPADFLRCLPHFYYEENNLHGFLIEKIRDFDGCIAALDAFLPHVDNWATCDGMNPKILGRHLQKLDGQVETWLSSPHVYAVRFAIVMRMRYFLGEAFDISQAERIAALPGEDYYIRMAVAWYFATALAWQWDSIYPFISECRLDAWTRGKAIQKAVESRRISPQQKEILKKHRVSGRKQS